MVSKWIVALCLAVVLIACAVAKPLSTINENDVVEFLKQDKGFLSAIQNGKMPAAIQQALIRNRRQTEEVDVDMEEVPKPKEPGFFDRAAKFVMELLQRFLKWINTDDNQ